MEIKLEAIIHDLVVDPKDVPKTTEFCIFIYQVKSGEKFVSNIAWYNPHPNNKQWYYPVNVPIHYYNAIGWIPLVSCKSKLTKYFNDKYQEVWK